jgi:hypothetical protein
MVDPRLPGEVRRELLDHVSSGTEATPHILLLSDSDITQDGHLQTRIASGAWDKLRSQVVESWKLSSNRCKEVTFELATH